MSAENCADCRDLHVQLAGKQERIEELLALTVRLTNEVPFADEVTGWIEQRAKMVAEVGTYRAKAAELMRENNALRTRVRNLEAKEEQYLKSLVMGGGA